MDRINATAACVLGILQLGPAPGSPGFGRANADIGMSGWDVHAAASVSLARFWTITRSQVYRELQRLADAGLVEPAGAGGEPRERRPYRITQAGRDAFARWLADWAARGPRPEQLRSPLVLTVFFGELLGDEALARLLEEYRLDHLRRLDALRAMRAALGPHAARLPAFTVRRGIAYHELMVAWIDDVRAELAAR